MIWVLSPFDIPTPLKSLVKAVASDPDAGIGIALVSNVYLKEYPAGASILGVAVKLGVDITIATLNYSIKFLVATLNTPSTWFPIWFKLPLTVISAPPSPSNDETSFETLIFLAG